MASQSREDMQDGLLLNRLLETGRKNKKVVSGIGRVAAVDKRKKGETAIVLVRLAHRFTKEERKGKGKHQAKVPPQSRNNLSFVAPFR